MHARPIGFEIERSAPSRPRRFLARRLLDLSTVAASHTRARDRASRGRARGDSDSAHARARSHGDARGGRSEAKHRAPPSVPSARGASTDAARIKSTRIAGRVAGR
eukprot:31374-Pelagococcus_subviridis.AAC.11